MYYVTSVQYFSRKSRRINTQSDPLEITKIIIFTEKLKI